MARTQIRQPEMQQNILPEPLLHLVFRSSPDRLSMVRASVHSAALACGFDEAAARDIVLAIDEACTNVIVHAYNNRDDADIVLDIFRTDRGILIQLRDFAPPASPQGFKPRDLNRLSPGGLGTHFIREIMDETRFMRAPEGDGNILEMTKKAQRLI